MTRRPLIRCYQAPTGRWWYVIGVGIDSRVSLWRVLWPALTRRNVKVFPYDA